MPSSSIKFLQLSDLLVTPKTAPLLIAELTKIITTRQEIHQVDCIVLCGNLVKDPSGFEVLPAVIRSLQPCIGESSNSFAHHVLLTPGPSDVTGPDKRLDFGPFTQFYDSFFADVFGPGETGFDPKTPIVRKCRKLNWIGALWWSGKQGSKPSKNLQGPRELARAAEAVKSAIGELPYDYPQFRPTVLISAETPLLDLAQRRLAWPEQVLYKLVDIHLHLFGSGSVAYLNAEPFTAKYRSIGTGPREKGDAWPLSVNLLEVHATHQADRSSPIEVSARSYVKRDPMSTWQEDMFLAASSSHPSNGDPGTFLYDAFEQSVHSALFESNRTVALITGLRGMWQKDLMNALFVRQRIANHNCDVLKALQLTNYENVRMFSGEIEKLIEGNTPSGADRVVLVQDLAFSASSEDSQRLEYLQEMMHELRKLGRNTIRFLYFVNLFDQPVDTLGVGEPIFLPPVDDASLKRFVAEYERLIPLREDDLRSITQGYYDFSCGFLKHLKLHFEDFPGVFPLGADSHTDLLLSTIQNSDQLQRDAGQFVKDLRKIHGGGAIVNHIRELLKLKARRGGGLEAALKERVKFAALEIGAPQGDQRDIHRALEFFTQYHVLRKQANHYVLCEKIPFLLAAYKLEPQGSSDLNGQVFLSYDHADKETAEEYCQWITDQWIGDQKIEVWWDPRLYRPNYRKEIAEQLEISNAVIVLWTKTSVTRDWVKNEASRGLASGRLINVLKDVTAKDLPMPFSEANCYDFKDRDRVLKAIVHLLQKPSVATVGVR